MSVCNNGFYDKADLEYLITCRPSAEEFRSALPWFVQENPDRSCPKAGKAAYANSIAMREVDNSYEVTASAFFTFHSVLRSSSVSKCLCSSHDMFHPYVVHRTSRSPCAGPTN